MISFRGGLFLRCKFYRCELFLDAILEKLESENTFIQGSGPCFNYVFQEGVCRGLGLGLAELCFSLFGPPHTYSVIFALLPKLTHPEAWKCGTFRLGC